MTVSETQYAAANGLKIAYETFGSPAGTPVLLIMGLGTQMIAWPDELCEQIAAAGHYVIRFDNRDVGLSTHLDDAPVPKLAEMLLRRGKPPYKISDMAADAVGLLDALEIDKAHVVGASLGGFIAQTVAGLYPDRVRSLTLIMTSTGSRRVGYPHPKVAPRLLRRRPVPNREAAIEAVLETFSIIGSRGFDRDEDYLRDLAGRSFDRSHDARGYLRQLAAVMAQPNRTRFLKDIKAPTVVIHGKADPLVHVSGGRSIARSIPGAKLVTYDGMGHDLPRALWSKIADEIVAIAARGDQLANSNANAAAG